MAVIRPWLRCIKAGGISVFILPVNISFQWAYFNSGWLLRLFPIASAASMPTVLPEKVSVVIILVALICSTISLASLAVLTFKPWSAKLNSKSPPTTSSALVSTTYSKDLRRKWWVVKFKRRPLVAGVTSHLEPTGAQPTKCRFCNYKFILLAVLHCATLCSKSEFMLTIIVMNKIQCNLNLVTSCDLLPILQNTIFQLIHKIFTFRNLATLCNLVIFFWRPKVLLHQ